jgi:hypothetical protein
VVPAFAPELLATNSSTAVMALELSRSYSLGGEVTDSAQLLGSFPGASSVVATGFGVQLPLELVLPPGSPGQVRRRSATAHPGRRQKRCC